MSLDVYLDLHFKDEDGKPYSHQVFSKNITHNLATMADAAGLYKWLWRPDEQFQPNHAIKAKEIRNHVKAGLAELITNPAKYKEFNPSNGWGDYDGLVRFTKAYLEALNEHPNAEVSVSR